MSNYQDLMGSLKLSGMRESIDYRIDEAEQSNLDLREFVTLLLEDERSYRRNRKAELLTRRAKFNINSSLEEFDADLKRGVTKGMVKQLGTLHFLNQSENVIFVGGTGAGKSFLAQALGLRACLTGIETLYLPVNKFFKQVEEAEASGSYLKLQERIKKAKLIILDDFGLRNYTHNEATTLYDILEDRYRKGSVVVTSQVKPAGWKLLFEDEVIAEAIVDRLESCAHTIEIKGLSYRNGHRPKERIECKK